MRVLALVCGIFAISCLVLACFRCCCVLWNCEAHCTTPALVYLIMFCKTYWFFAVTDHCMPYKQGLLLTDVTMWKCPFRFI
ncbi:hypothetical protein DUNSADRAFT_3885 [Dunaliella salina]|uniref:Secreted protein n=1 Tax=Dunaliella salina TaxID=3046 RepID=A0ABQ7GT40_DUNSA|nr:hypothetical protein DUNSADRAFT_3885 [Dunaliella salina]|eukprot:KAF5837742.1 hypothetical protein DUNSADRAFT_3885 [Dunaliella salina]